MRQSKAAILNYINLNNSKIKEKQIWILPQVVALEVILRAVTQSLNMRTWNWTHIGDVKKELRKKYIEFDLLGMILASSVKFHKLVRFR